MPVLTAASVAIPMWQAIQKGGWWLRTMCYVTEQHLRIGRAVLGLVHADEEQPSPSKVFDDVMYGRFPQASYVYLNALMASIFADAAITEHQQGRRVHRTDSTGTTLPLPIKSAFAANKLVVPRYAMFLGGEPGERNKPPPRCEPVRVQRAARSHPYMQWSGGVHRPSSS